MPTATVLVTGVSGFIAKHCAVDLLNHGYRVRGTVRSLAKSGDRPRSGLVVKPDRGSFGCQQGIKIRLTR